MTRLRSILLLLALLAAPAVAQEADPPADPSADPSEGLGLIEEGARELLRGLLEDAQPALDELAGIGDELLPTFRLLAREMGPAFAEVIGQVDSLENYEPPAFLPNGDIIMRRREGAPPWTPPADATAPGAEIEL